MSRTGRLRGHRIAFVGGRWIYRDTGEPTAGNPRECGHCGRANTPEGHDGCLGTLPFVKNACCGHGVDDEAYIALRGETVRGPMALDLAEVLMSYRARHYRRNRRGGGRGVSLSSEARAIANNVLNNPNTRYTERRVLANEVVSCHLALMAAASESEALREEVDKLRRAICPDGSIADTDELVEHAAELNLCETKLGMLCNPEQRMLEENERLGNRVRDLEDWMRKQAGHGTGCNAVGFTDDDGCFHEGDACDCGLDRLLGDQHAG